MSNALTGIIDSLEEELRDYIDGERERIEAERDFLLAVLDGRSDGVTVEDVSTDLTQSYLSGYLSEFIPIEQDISNPSE